MAPVRNTSGPHMTTTTLKVEGMTCGACTSSVESGFQGVDGVGNVSVSLVMERAVVVHDASKITAQAVRDMIEDRGFDAEVLASDKPDKAPRDLDLEEELGTDEQILGKAISTTTIHVGGMTCGACTSAVEGAFKHVSGIKTFNISLLSERAVIEHDSTIIPAEKLAETIEDTGFDAEIIETKLTEPVTTKPRAPSKILQKKLVTTTVAIQGMTCGACVSAVESGFNDVVGCSQFNISLLAERAVIMHDPEKLSVTQIIELIEDRGFDASLISSQEESTQTSTSAVNVQFKVYGLPSPEAAADLQATLQKLSGIDSVKIDPMSNRASISHSPSKIGLRSIVDAIENAGYNALVADNDDNNAQLESLAKTKEIQEWYRAFKVSISFAIPVFLISMFFPMFVKFLDFGSLNAHGIWLGDVVCLLLTIPVQFGIGKRFYVSAFKSLRHGSPTMDVLVVLGTSAAFFFSCAAMLVSILVPPHSRPATTFDTSTMLIMFISLGRFLENRAKGQTSRALSRLMSLAPSSATIYADPIAAVKAAEGWNVGVQSSEKKNDMEAPGSAMEEKTVPSELIEVGDIVILRPGDKIPADGTVIRGDSYVNESMVTGEAMPILKKPGSSVLSGTVNGAGRIDFKVTRAGRDTQLSQIVRLVQEAQTTRAPIQRMADVVAGYFVPIIIALGLATFIGWMVLSHMLPNPPKIFLSQASGGRVMVCVQLCIAVIVFACPCALGLATPTAVMVGTGVGAENGILVKGGAALETATKISHVVLDKTGTLTMGQMSVSTSALSAAWNSSSEKRLLWWSIVGLAESNSEHPIAKAIVAGAKERLGLGVDATIEGSAGDFASTVGKGISARVEPTTDRRRYEAQIGNASFLQSQGIAVSTEPEIDRDMPNDTSANKLWSEDDDAGTTMIHVAIDGKYSGSLGLSDILKPTATACISALHALNITTSLVTGDQATTAYRVASLVGIPSENVYAGVLPLGKQDIVEDLQKQGHVVAMVGDGINDSPALATADVGISLASGTDVAMEAADVVLMKPTRLLDIPASLHLSRTIFRRIKLNLLFSCIYNVIGIPIAMGFFLPWGVTLPPLAAGAAMASSSVTVVVSSLLLKFWSRPTWMIEDEVSVEVSEYKRGLWARIGAVRDTFRGRKTKDRDRGVYVQLDNYEAV